MEKKGDGTGSAGYHPLKKKIKICRSPIKLFFYKWPRNFAISLGVEMCIAQPAARFVMLKLHMAIDRRTLPQEQKEHGGKWEELIPEKLQNMQNQISD
ncbi:hypothetical protein [Hominibacterium faecale]|uniref:hypothetical protein n=1 Tax=Hominibacterium faecale TaxID=2839743 RepID=UPI0022B2AB3D|nr:hypothetical protein [Hominibacterium faecale]